MTKQTVSLPRFPTALRKMWSGGEVQAWLDEHVAPLLAAARLKPLDEGARVEPDMVWLAADGEQGGVSADEFAQQQADDMRVGDGPIVIAVTCARSLPDRKMRVWLERDDDGAVESRWEWVPEEQPAQEVQGNHHG